MNNNFKSIKIDENEYQQKLHKKKECFNAYVNSLSNEQIELFKEYLKAKKEFDNLLAYPQLEIEEEWIF